MKLIVGLGNPTDKYSGTYHNLGFMAVDRLADKLNIKIKNKECEALTGVTSVKGEQVVLAKPQTYMNLSGVSVSQLAKKYGAKAEEILIVYDDADLPMSKLRVRKEGSAGTHNGMRNIVSILGTTAFPRLRIGIKSENSDIEIKERVLSKISKSDGELIFPAVEKAAEGLALYIYGEKDIEALMRELN
ncbi:MAG: aminoacyl-tRNA hydrolase [Clostridiales bacterium]|nr:aminoacyl-tRNA hydrolase [Clostridiales bacterium]